MKNFQGQGIYMIFNTINDKCYVGSSKNIYERKRQHLKELKNNRHHSNHLQRAWNKYGEDSFIFVKLEEVSLTEDLCEREVFWILQKDSLNSKFGYNLGIPKQSDNCCLRVETIEKLLISTYNQFHLNNPNITLEDFLNGKRAKHLKEKFGHLNKKKVLCFNSKTGEKEFEFSSVLESAKHFNTTDNYIRRILDVENKTCKGLIFITEDNFDSSKSYKKVYKTSTYQPKGKFKGNAIETYNLDTEEAIQEFSNKKEMASHYNVSVSSFSKILYNERKSWRGMGIRYK